VLAEWLADCGARQLVFDQPKRRLHARGEIVSFFRKLRDRGVKTQVVQADIGSAEDVARLISEVRTSGNPLKGVFHLAMVIDDAPIGSAHPRTNCAR